MKAFTKTLFFAFLVMSFAFAGCNAAKEEATEETTSDAATMEMEVAPEAMDVTVEVAPEATEAAEAEVAQ